MYIYLLCWDISKQIQIELQVDNLSQFHIGFGGEKSSEWLHSNSKHELMMYVLLFYTYHLPLVSH